MTTRTPLNGLQAEEYMHPADRSSIDTVRGYLAFERMLDRLFGEGFEEDLHLLALANHVKLGKLQGSRIVGMAAEASYVLGVSCPTLFLEVDDAPSALAFGDQSPLLMLSTGLVERCSDSQLYVAIARELGHLQCRHGRYALLARNIPLLMHVAGAVPMLGTALGVGFYMSLAAWYQRAAFSADRAALLATQSLDQVLDALMWWAAGGSESVQREMSVEALLEQADEYSRLQQEARSRSQARRWASPFATLLQSRSASHPWPALRVREIRRFAQSERYRGLLRGEHPADREAADPSLAAEGLAAGVHVERLGESVTAAAGKMSGYGRSAAEYLKEKMKQLSDR